MLLILAINKSCWILLVPNNFNVVLITIAAMNAGDRILKNLNSSRT